MVITICAFKFVIYMGNGTSYSDAPISGTGRVRRIKMVYSDSWRAPLSGDINFMSESEKDLASPRRQALPYICQYYCRARCLTALHATSGLVSCCPTGRTHSPSCLGPNKLRNHMPSVVWSAFVHSQYFASIALPMFQINCILDICILFPCISELPLTS